MSILNRVFLDLVKHTEGGPLHRIFLTDALCIGQTVLGMVTLFFAAARSLTNDSYVKHNQIKVIRGILKLISTEKQRTKQTDAESFSVQKQMLCFKTHSIFDLPIPGSQ